MESEEAPDEVGASEGLIQILEKLAEPTTKTQNLPFALGAAAWEAADRTSFKRWGPVVGLILALLALLFLPA